MSAYSLRHNDNHVFNKAALGDVMLWIMRGTVSTYPFFCYGFIFSHLSFLMLPIKYALKSNMWNNLPQRFPKFELKKKKKKLLLSECNFLYGVSSTWYTISMFV